MRELIYSTRQKSILILLLFFSISSFAALHYMDYKGTFIPAAEVPHELNIDEDVSGKLLHVPQMLETLEALIRRV